MSVLAVIPARQAASRFPGKPLADLHGLPMVMHCYYRARLANLIDDIVIATCDEEIARVAHDFEVPVVMTSEEHLTAVDRAAEAVQHHKKTRADLPEVVLLVQGDEPLLEPTILDLMVSTITSDSTINVLNVMVPFARYEDFEDPNNPKVVINARGDALYMSREAVPSAWRSWDASIAHMQTGLFAFRPAALQLFADTPRTSVETAESIDMLRLLHAGHQVRMLPVDEPSIGVDTPQDLAKVADLMVDDRHLRRYRDADARSRAQ